MADGAPEVFRGRQRPQGPQPDQGQARGSDGRGRGHHRGDLLGPVITHVCLEPHGLTVKWEGDDKIVAWASTQNVSGVGQRSGRRVQDPAGERDGLHRLHGGRLRLQVRRRHLGPDGGPALQEGRRPAGQDVPRPRAGAPGGGQPSQRLRPTSSWGQPRRQDRRHDRRGARHRRRRRRRRRDPALCLSGVRQHAGDAIDRLHQLRQRAGHAGPAPSSELRCSPKRPWTTWPTSWGWTRSSSGSRTCPTRADFHTPIYEAELKMGAELIGWQREAQAARPDRHRPDPPRAGRGPAPVGRRRQPGQEGLLHDQPRRLGRAQDRHPGHRHRRPDGPGDHRRRGPRPQADRHHLQHRQLDLPARPGLGRLDHDAVDVPAVLRRASPRPATRSSRRSRRPSTAPRPRTSRSRTASSGSRASR